MRLRELILLSVIIAIFFSLFLGSRPLSVPDEGRYVEIPREMAVTGDWVTPRLNGVKYFEKPPLFYWFEAVLIKLFGLSEWSVRIGPALFALFGCLAVYYAGARMFGASAGLFSALVLATSILYYATSRLITLDMPVSVLLTISMLFFLLGTREPAGPGRRFFFWTFYTFAALAVLTKGLIGIVFPGMIIFVWMLLMNEWRVLRSMHLVSGMLVFLAIALPWHILVQQANPEFFRFYFIHEHFERYLTKVHGRFKPFWFFIPILLGGLLPWTAFLPQAIRHNLPHAWKDRAKHSEVLFLLLWAGLVFLFFSRSDSKLIPYILPVFPPLALIIGKYLSEVWDGRHTYGVRCGAITLVAFYCLFSIALLVAPHFRPEIDMHELRPHLYALVAIQLVSVAALWMLYRKAGSKYAIGSLLVCTMLFLTVCNTLMPYLDTRSAKELAHTMRPLLRPGSEVIAYHTYYQDLPVYLERTIAVTGWTGELDFGSQQENVSGWMIGEAECWKRWDGPNKVFLVTSKTNYDTLLKNSGRTFTIVDDSLRDIVLTNERTH